MSDERLEERVRGLIGRTFGLTDADLGADPRMGGLPGWDSMGHMDLVVALENEFGISISTPRIAEIVDVEKICANIRQASKT